MTVSTPRKKTKPVTAQVPDDSRRFGVNSRGKEHWNEATQAMVSDNELTQAAGCYRRVPTCKE